MQFSVLQPDQVVVVGGACVCAHMCACVCACVWGVFALYGHSATQVPSVFGSSLLKALGNVATQPSEDGTE